MYIPNTNVTRIVAWTLSGSILTTSCVNNSPFGDYDSLAMISGQEKKLCCAIRVKLSKEDAAYIEKMSQLADDLVKKPQTARQLLENAPALLRTRGVEVSNLFLDRELENVTLALADEDISDAIKRQDVKSYLLLMNERGLLKKTTEEHYDVLTLEQRKEILMSLGIPEAEVEDFPFIIGAVVSILYIAVAVISYGAVAYTAIAAVNMAALATVAYRVAAVTSTKVSGYTNFDLAKDPNFDIWILKCNDEKIVLPIKEYEEAIKDVIATYRQIGGEKMKFLTDEQLEAIMNANILKNMQQLKNNGR